MAEGSRLPDRAAALAGLCVLLAAWEALGRARLLGLTFPPLTDVLALFSDPERRALLERALTATWETAALGYLAGAALGALVGLAGHFSGLARPGLDRLAAFVNAVPGVVIAPILIVTVGRGAAPATLAALHVYFLVYVAMTSGLRAASASHHDVLSALGARRARRFLSLELPAALPTLVTALKLSAPAALLGAILGEWFGAERGLGVLILNAMQNFQIPLLWAAVLLAACASMACYGALGAAEAFVHGRFRP